MKRIVCIFLLLAAVVAGIPVRAESRQYEVWEKSPEITSGVTSERIYIWKAMSNGLFEAFKLDALGSNYYLGIVHDKRSDGGKFGKTDVDLIRYYLLLAEEDDFIILDSVSLYNEYKQENDLYISDISDKINTSFYKNNGSDLPMYVVEPGSFYTWSDYTYYYEKVVITDKAKFCFVQEKNECALKLKDNIVYFTREYQSGNNELVSVRAMSFKGKNISYAENTDVEKDEFESDTSYLSLGTDSTMAQRRSAYYPIPNTEDMYVRVTPVLRTASSSGEYYDQRIEVVKKVNGQMTVISDYYNAINKKQEENTVLYLSDDDIDASYYENKGVPKPILIVNNIVIDEHYDIHTIDFGADKSTYQSWNLILYNKKLAVARNKDGTKEIYHRNDNNKYVYWQKINYIYFDSSGMVKEPDIELEQGKQDGMNGYYYGRYSFTKPSLQALSSEFNWFGREKTNVFPDGRSMKGRWVNNAEDQELYIEVYDKSGNIMSTTRTGWIRTNYEDSNVFCYPVNNTKVIVTLGRMQNSDYFEFYRAGVVNETEEGEIGGFGSSGGTKNLTPPDTADTEPVQYSIDFDKTDLPIGFNIKDNVVEDNKLSPELRDQINAIRLNDIVILKKEQYQSGTQNAGTTLKSFSQYDYSMGNTGVYVYTNGQNFNWYCTEPEKLAEGTYNRTYNIGEKTVYVTFKIVQPPSNDGVTTVVF